MTGRQNTQNLRRQGLGPVLDLSLVVQHLFQMGPELCHILPELSVPFGLVLAGEFGQTLSNRSPWSDRISFGNKMDHRLPHQIINLGWRQMFPFGIIQLPPAQFKRNLAVLVDPAGKYSFAPWAGPGLFEAVFNSEMF